MVTSTRKPSDLKRVTLSGGAGGEGRLQIRPVEVEDPYNPGRTTVAMKNVRSTPIDQMLYQRRIHGGQYAAAIRFQRLCEKAEIGPLQGVDYSRQKVDGGQASEILTQVVANARKQLLEVPTVVGRVGYTILCAVVGRGESIRRFVENHPAYLYGLEGRRAEGYVSGKIVEGLDSLILHWGMVAKNPNRAAPIKGDANMSLTGPVTEYEVGLFGDLVERPLKRPE
jgi:hypothetical protein